MKIEYNKLVRDRIPEIINNEGKLPIIKQVKGKEKLCYLYEKLIEEATELKEGELVEELADVQEVLEVIMEELNITPEQMKIAKNKKRKERGGFKKGTVLLYVEEK